MIRNEWTEDYLKTVHMVVTKKISQKKNIDDPIIINCSKDLDHVGFETKN